MIKFRRLALLTLPVLSSPLFGGQADAFFNQEYYSGYSNTPDSENYKYYDAVGRNTPLWDLSFEQWYKGPGAVSNCFGVRPALEDNGVTPIFTYVGNFAANPVGGRAHGATNTSSVNLGLGIDFEELFDESSLKGFSLGNTWVWRFGDSLTKDYIGNTFNVQQNYGNQTMQLYSLFLQYDAEIGDDLNIIAKAGRFGAGDNFLTKPIYWMYMNNAFDGNPVGIFNQISWSAYPTGTWAAFAQIYSDDGIYLKAGVYQINAPDTEHGLNFSFTEGLGVNTNYEIGWDINHDDSGKSPGNVSAGIACDWMDVHYQSDPTQFKDFNYSTYFQADYMVLNLGPATNPETPTYIQRTPDQMYRDLRGIVLWGCLQYDPDETLAYMPFFINGGFLLNGMIESRKDDVICFGVAYGAYSDELNTPQNGSYETVFEVNYKFQINRFAFIQPAVQFILNPAGGEYDDALVLGMQFGISL